ncbi:hypothetical protein C2G38_2182739 [Gigaspora rosea]|uniref:Uncharacterized protein n=1 Tax=Gigaspora rosea TaxID=44941 RepID=A0A397V986_9GLOM|nr:hypothetical protein C2G38_2182739 [Gigaspora rosea]
MSEFEVFQENLAERLEALTPQKEKNNKKPKKGYDNTLEENTKSMRTDLEMQMYSMTSSEQLNKTNESHDVVIILSEPNTNKEDGQVSQINSKTDQSEQQMEIDVEPEVTGDKHKNKTKKMSYSAVVTETKSEAKIKFESERKNKIKRCIEKILKASSSMKTEEFNEEFWTRDKIIYRGIQLSRQTIKIYWAQIRKKEYKQGDSENYRKEDDI